MDNNTVQYCCNGRASLEYVFVNFVKSVFHEIHEHIFTVLEYFIQAKAQPSFYLGHVALPQEKLAHL